jgi:hypothetical protein
MLYTVIFVLWVASQVSGFLFASYGVLRASFSDLGQIGFGEGLFGEGTGGRPTKLQRVLLNVGLQIGLLPADQVLTVTDKRGNAAKAIAGVVLFGLSIVLDLWLKYLSR